MLKKTTLFAVFILFTTLSLAYNVTDDDTPFGYHDSDFGPKPKSITFSLFTGIYTNGVNQNFPQQINRYRDIWRYGLRLGYQIDQNWSVESTMGYTPTIDNNFDMFVYDGALSANYDYSLTENFVLYATLGPGFLHFRTPNVNTFTRAAVFYGAGIKFFAFRNMNLRLELLAISTFDPGNTAIAPSLGLQYYFQNQNSRNARRKQALAPAEPIMVREPAVVLEPAEPFQEPRDLSGSFVETQKFEEAPLEDHVVAKEQSSRQDQFIIATTIIDQELEEFSGTIDGIHFNTGKATILIDSYAKLNKGAKIFNKYPKLKFVIEGHTDSTGSLATNMRLAKERAESVRNYLLSQGVNQSQMTVEAVGPGRPIADNATDDGRARNRRIEFRLLNVDEIKKEAQQRVR